MQNLVKNAVFDLRRGRARAGIRLGCSTLRRRLFRHIRTVILCVQNKRKREHRHQDNFLQP